MTNRTDNFNRANGNLSGSTPSDGGGVWAVSGTWQVLTNAANKSATAATVEAAWLESSVANVEVTATMKAVANCGLVARVTDSLNYIYAQTADFNLKMWKVEAGVLTQLGATDTSTTAINDVFVLRASGNDLILKQNGVARVTTTSAFNNTATKHGLSATGLDASWDDLSITEISTGIATRALLLGVGR